jgi:uncharacterized protein
MLIRVQDLQLQEIRYQEEFRPGALDFGAGVQQKSVLHASGRAELLEEHEGARKIQDIRVVGKFSTRLEMSCARCLDPVSRQVSASFDLIYRPLGADARPEESSISEAETEIGFYQGEGVLLEDVLREQIMLALPLKAVCREACKGICPGCGRNLNTEVCVCPPLESDSRWLALKGIKEKLQD